MALFQRLIELKKVAGLTSADAGPQTPQPPQRTKGLPARDRMDAKHQEDDVALWRDYYAFLTARRALLDVRIAEARAAFEQAEALEDQARQAQLRLDTIPASVRTMFEHVLEERRQQVQADLEAELRATRSAGRTRYADPDEIDRAALEELIGEAQGETTENNLGLFPRGIAGDIRWYGLDVTELLAAPTAASYTVKKGKGDDAQRRIIQAVAAAVVGLLFLAYWLLVPHGAPPPRLTTANAPSVNGIPVAVWPVQSAILTTQQGTTTALTLTATTAAALPTDAPDGRAYWRSTAIAPLVICVAPALLSDLASVRLISPDSWPERVYSVGSIRTAATDLRIEACDSTESKQAIRYGVLQEAVAPVSYAIGTPVALQNDAETITVTRIRVIGPGQEPALPAGQARIVVQVQAPLTLDWPAYKPTLTLANGQRFLPSATARVGSGAELRYLVPLSGSEIGLAWDLTPPGATQSTRWRATLPPPPSREAVLAQAVTIEQIVASEERAGEVTIVVAVSNHGSEPLILTREDVTLSQGGRLITLTNSAALADPIAVDGQRTLTFTLPLGALAQPATLTIGGVPFQIAR